MVLTPKHLTEEESDGVDDDYNHRYSPCLQDTGESTNTDKYMGIDIQ